MMNAIRSFLIVPAVTLFLFSISFVHADIPWIAKVEFSSGSQMVAVFRSDHSVGDLTGSGTVTIDPTILHYFAWDGPDDFSNATFVGTSEYQDTRMTWNKSTQKIDSIWKGNPSQAGWPIQWGSGASGTDLLQIQLFGSPTIRDGDGTPDSSDSSEVGSIISVSILPQIVQTIDWTFAVKFSTNATAAGEFQSDGSLFDLFGSGTSVFNPTDLISFVWQGTSNFESSGILNTTEYQDTRMTWNKSTQNIDSIWKGNPSQSGWPIQWGSGAPGTDLLQIQLFGSPTIRDSDGYPDSSIPGEVGSIVDIAILPSFY